MIMINTFLLDIFKGKPARSWLSHGYGSEKGLRAPGTHVQVLEAVPAERVLAVLTHHLRAALIAFDVHPAHGARLNGGFCVHAKEGPGSRTGDTGQGRGYKCNLTF